MATLQQKPSESLPASYSQVPPPHAAAITEMLKGKSVDELKKILNDEKTYETLLHSLEQVKIQDKVWNDLRKETVELAMENLEKEPRLAELRNQCMIIRTSELASAQEKFSELEKEKEETLRLYAPVTLMKMMQDAATEVDDESEKLYEEFRIGNIDLPTFLTKYRKLRLTYHRRVLLHLASKTST